MHIRKFRRCVGPLIASPQIIHFRTERMEHPTLATFTNPSISIGPYLTVSIFWKKRIYVFADCRSFKSANNLCPQIPNPQIA